MAIQPFNDILYVEALDTGTPVIAEVTPSNNLELAYIRAFIYMQGAPSATSKCYLQVHTSSNTSRVYAESDRVNLSSFSLGDNSLTWVRFDFGGQTMLSGRKYYISIHHENYTKSGETHYLSIVYDWPMRGNPNGDAATAVHPTTFPKAIQIFGRE